MILAAGLATRLKPLTDHTPKALVRFNKEPLLHRVVNNLLDAGIEAIIVNVHHYPDQIINFLREQKNYGGRVVISDEKRHLMDTGGAITHAAWFLDDGNPFLVHNVDVYTNLNIRELIDCHLKSDSLVTLAVKDRPTSRSLLFNDQLRLIGWRHNETGEEIYIKDEQQVAYSYGNSCVQVIQPEFFNLVNHDSPFSLTKSYLDLARDHLVRGHVHNDDYWFDLGRYNNFKEAETFFTS